MRGVAWALAERVSEALAELVSWRDGLLGAEIGVPGWLQWHWIGD